LDNRYNLQMALLLHRATHTGIGLSITSQRR